MDGPGTILAYAYIAPNADMVIDTDETTNFTTTTNFNRSFRNIVMHELGHSFGMGHVNSSTHIFLMEPALNTSVDGPQHDDIRGVQHFYGDRHENNESAAAATDLGTLGSGTFNFGDPPVDGVGAVPGPVATSILAMSVNGDFDYYKFTIPVGRTMTATVSPVGFSQSVGPEGSSETFVNTISVTALSVSIFAPNGTTSLAFAGAFSAGSSVSTPVASLATPGTYYVRVAELENPLQPQMYKLSLSLTLNNEPPVLASIGNQVINEGSNLAFSISATDPNPGQTLTYSMTGAPSGATLNPTTGAFSWTPGELQGPGTYNVTFTAADDGSPSLSDSEVVTITVNEVNQNPTLIWTTPNNTTVFEGNSLIFDANHTDNDLPANTITYSLPIAPAGAVINPINGIFSWTPSPAQIPGTYVLRVRASDGVGGFAERTINVIAAIAEKTFKGKLTTDAWPISLVEKLTIRYEVRAPGSQVALATGTLLANNGDNEFSFSTTDIPKGTYDIWFKSNIHLAYLYSNQFVETGGALLGTATLLSADCDDNNAVTTDDYLIISESFDLGVGDVGYDSRADIDGTDFVNTDDYLVLSLNFDLSGPE